MRAWPGIGAGIGLMLAMAGMAHAAQPETLCRAYSGLPDGSGPTAGMVQIPGGAFVMGSDQREPEERSTHLVRVDGFYMDSHEVTNAQFERFVDATGYVTRAERGPDASQHKGLPDDVMGAGSVVFTPPTKDGDITRWWKYVKGTSWRAPEGPGSTIKGRQNEPVVHVAYEDAQAYAEWLGRELPTEAQWEYAARGGRDDATEIVGAFDADGKPAANTWQGIFPVINTVDDGYVGRAPVGCFKPNPFGLYDMIGNAWEWTSDWYASGHQRAPASNPLGPNLLQVRLAAGATPVKVIKGGSYLCSNNFCTRYRASARQPQEIDLGTSHIGFRTVLNRNP
ncbi:MAG: formylglycine-generating enzyme family protein [Hyphomicrobium sp.]